jgi:N-acetylneuraminic acid mutarotase
MRRTTTKLTLCLLVLTAGCKKELQKEPLQINQSTPVLSSIVSKAPRSVPYNMTQRSKTVTDFVRDGSRMMQVGNYMYSFGGWSASPEDSYNDIYRSSDNLSVWEKRPNAPWHGRHVFGCVKLNNIVFIIGGDNLHTEFDIWSSKNGEKWFKLANSPFGNIIYYGAVAHNGALYVMGGVNTDKVWRSVDGITWTEIASGLEFLHRNIAGSVISFNNKIWVVSGGGDGFGSGIANKTVYSSADGIEWKKEADFPGVGVQYTDVTVWDNKLWVIGGFVPDYGNSRDIWYMNAQGTWTQFVPPADYVGRHATGVGVYSNKLVITCGNYNNDCWVIEKI